MPRRLRINVVSPPWVKETMVKLGMDQASGLAQPTWRKRMCGPLRPMTYRSERAPFDQIFRYAPLSSGLDIVRKILGRHEIATLQTTSIDQTAGIINLTTVLAHASGEWIASDWPVCPVSETSTPQRMGAALTYARRYGLFTLVGIAGEDDLDAPDLMTPTTQTPGPERLKRQGNGQVCSAQDRLSIERRRDSSSELAIKPTLGAESSAHLRDRLLAELTDISSSDDAAMWAHKKLVEKNQLIAADAQRIEAAFQSHLAQFKINAEMPEPSREIQQRSSDLNENTGRSNCQSSTVVDKGTLTFPESRRVRDRNHVKFVAQHPCLVCGRRPADAHHLRFVQSRALSRKVSDEFAVPLCRGHHREVHRYGDEAAWWSKTGVDASACCGSKAIRPHLAKARMAPPLFIRRLSSTISCRAI